MQEDPYRATDVVLEADGLKVPFRTRLYKFFAGAYVIVFVMSGFIVGIAAAQLRFDTRNHAFGWIIEVLLGGLGAALVGLPAIGVWNLVELILAKLLRRPTSR